MLRPHNRRDASEYDTIYSVKCTVYSVKSTHQSRTRLKVTMSSRPKISTVLSTLTWKPDEIARVRDAFSPARFFQCDMNDKTAISKGLREAQVLLLAGDLDDTALSAPHVSWIHCDHAGLNHSARADVFKRGIVVTGSAGRSGPALAQHAFYFALAFTYDIRNHLDRQARHVWEGAERYRERGALWGKRLAIVGYGYTGREMARLGKAFGMHVTVLRRSGDNEEDVDVMLRTEQGDTVGKLLDADIIMVATSLTDQTYHMFSTEQFKRMKSTAVIINLARGGVIDESALIKALNAGEIAGAGLDVFEHEPLPSNSALWDMPNVLITPHATPQMPDKTQRSMDVILGNLERYSSGQALINALDEQDLYTKG